MKYAAAALLLAMNLACLVVYGEEPLTPHKYYNPREPEVVYIVDHGSYYTFYGPDKELSRIICDVGDLVWNGWVADPDGRKYYIGYVKQIKNNTISIAKKNFLEGEVEVKWRKIMKIKGIEIVERQED